MEHKRRYQGRCGSKELSAKGELVSERKLTTEQILFKLLVTFQPGGSGERAQILRVISEGYQGDTVSGVLQWVRGWRRNVTRAVEVGMVLPDALVMVGAVHKGSEVLSLKSPQVAYRLNLIRQQLLLDQHPSLEAVLTYTEHLQAEAEELELADSGVGQAGGVVREGTKPSKTSLKALTGGSGDGGTTGTPQKEPGKGAHQAVNAANVSSTQPCKFWGTNDGCRRGDRCKYVHSVLNPRDQRCFGCSALGHAKKDCPNMSSSHSGVPNSGEKKKKVAKTKGDKSKADAGEKGKEKESEKPLAPATEDMGRMSGDGLKGGGSSSGSGDCSGSSAPATTKGDDRIGDLLQEATALMKTLRPSVKVLSMKKSIAGVSATGLLDGGATNPLRRGTVEEIKSAVEVEVELAAGSTRLYQCVQTGTLLTKDEVEPIVPLRGLISLGYKILWDSHGYNINHPTHGRIRCWLRNGCPVVDEKKALALIQEIEEQERLRRLGPRLAVGAIGEPARIGGCLIFLKFLTMFFNIWLVKIRSMMARISPGTIGQGKELQEQRG